MVYIGFKKLAAKVGSPALAAWIGRKKYTKAGMAAKSAAGRVKAAARRKAAAG